MSLNQQTGKAVNDASTVSSQPLVRSASFAFSNQTFSMFSPQSTLPQKGAPANSSLLSELVSLTVAQPSCWRNFTLGPNEGFLAIDGASQSSVLRAQIELFSPNSSLLIVKNTTASQLLHYIDKNPAPGEWEIFLSLIDVGNTTAWIQATTINNGTREVVDYHKEITHMYAGQASYFKFSITANDWIDIHSQMLAGAYMSFETFLPTDYANPWDSSYYYSSYYDKFLSSDAVPQLGIYLLAVREYADSGGPVDVMIQLTKKTAVTKTLYPNAKVALTFNMTTENEYFVVDLNQTYEWLALDGGTASGGSTQYWLRDPSKSVIASLSSSSLYYPVSQMVTGPPVGIYLLIVQGSNQNTICTIQITASSVGETYLSTKSDVAISFVQTGQTAYYTINTTGKSYFVFSGSSEMGRTTYRLYNYRNEQVWTGDSTDTSDPRYILQPVVGDKYLLSVQGGMASVALCHLRFHSDYDYSISSPDYSDFEMRFSGDFLLYRLNVPDVAYIVQFWHNLASAYVTAQVYDSNYDNLGTISLSGQGAESRLIWRKNIENFAIGNWIVFLAGKKCQYVRVSHLTAGNEERIVSSPFQTFETFDFDYQAKIFLVNVPASFWFSTIASPQTISSFDLRVYDSQLTYEWEDSPGYYGFPHNYFQLWTNPKTGNWLIIVDGSTSTNASLSFHASVDPALACISGKNYTNDFGYYGKALYYETQLTNAPFLGFDAMGMANAHTDFLLVDPDGYVQYSSYSSSKFDVSHNMIQTPKNATWFIILIGSYLSKLIYRVTTGPDKIEVYPFTDSFSAYYDCAVTYASFNVSRLNTLDINVTSEVASDSWLWLHMPDGRVWDWSHLTIRQQIWRITVYGPPDGQWLLCIVQENFADLTIVCGGQSKPTPEPTGVFVTFIYPPDAQTYLINGSDVVLPELNGTINVVANVTDYYHSLQSVYLYYNGGINLTSMTYNPTSKFYEALFDTSMLPDGLSELVIYAQCQASEVGIGSITIRTNNNGTFPPIDDVTPPMISEVHQDPPSNVSAGQSPRVWISVADRDTAVSLVILSYSTDNGTTWNNITMSKSDKLTFETHLPAFPAGTTVTYLIIAYDYVQNRAFENNGGNYYVYTTVPEYTQLLAPLLFMMATLSAVFVCRKKDPTSSKKQRGENLIFAREPLSHLNEAQRV